MDEWIIAENSIDHNNLLSARCANKAYPLVRCKDCEHSEPWYGDKSRCFLWHETGIDVFNDGFCNYGERQKGR